MRALLSFTLAFIAMGIGLRSAFIQAQNFERGAQLDRLQVDLEWYQCRITGLRATLERMEFEALLEDRRNPEEGSE